MFGGAAPLNWASSKRWLNIRWPTGQAAALACCLEASATKAGNVTPAAAFSDMEFSDFLISGMSIAPVFECAGDKSVGELVLGAVTATRERLDINTNLGSILLLAPLAKAVATWERLQAHQTDPRSGATQLRPTMQHLQVVTRDVLNALTAHDAQLVYSAIRLAKPGGLGRAAIHEVHTAPPPDLRIAMAAVATLDAVARQYVNGFDDICGRLATWLRRSLARGCDLQQAITEVQLRWLTLEPDGLIVRKVGSQLAEEAQQLAAIALEEWLETGACGVRWHALDSFLRADGHSRNPGTTADLIAAALFVLLTTDEGPARPLGRPSLDQLG